MFRVWGLVNSVLTDLGSRGFEDLDPGFGALALALGGPGFTADKGLGSRISDSGFWT